MGLKRFLKKMANYILFSEPKQVVKVECGQLKNGKLIKNKNVVITGGSRGLGYAMAKRCIEEGANVIITGRNIENLEKATKELGGKCNYIQFDVANIKENTEFLKKCENVFKAPIDSLINNAGISLHEGDLLNVTEESYDKQMDVNLKGTYFLSQEFLKYKLEQNTKDKEKKSNSNLLIISSQAADFTSEIPYGLTKAALNSFVKALAKKYYQSGIRVNAVSPGVTFSDMTKEYADVNGGNMWANDNSGRYFIPEEVAEIVIFLLSNASICINGEIIHCNAGNHIK